MSYAPPYFPAPDAVLTEGVLTRRVFAWFIDLMLIAVLVCVAWIVVAVLGVLTLGLGFALMAALPAIGIAYHVLSVAGPRSATPGQLLLDIVVRNDADLGRPDLLQAIIFTGGLWLTLGSAFLLLVVAPFMPRKRALHDIVSGLVVVRKGALTQGTGSVNMAFGTPHR